MTDHPSGHDCGNHLPVLLLGPCHRNHCHRHFSFLFFCFFSLSIPSKIADINFLYVINTVNMGIRAFLLSDLFFTEV